MAPSFLYKQSSQSLQSNLETLADILDKEYDAGGQEKIITCLGAWYAHMTPRAHALLEVKHRLC